MNRKLSHVVKLVIGFASVGYLIVSVSTTALGAEFYKGKTIRLIVGFSPGGGPDIRARLVARHLGNHLPGHPRFIVQNKPGAGGLVTDNYLFNVAKRDGLTVASLDRDAANMQLGERVGVKFEMGKFEWIGSLMREGNVVFIRSDNPSRTLEDLKKAKRPLFFAARVVGASNYLAGKALEMLGVPVKLALGYGSTNTTLAFEQGEVDASALGWTSIKTGRPHWVKPGGLARLIVEFGMQRTPGIQVAFGPNLKPIPGKEGIYALINKALGLPQGNLAAPPGTPRKRVEELRQGYRKMLKDAKFKAHAAKLNIPVDPWIGKDLAGVFQKFLIASPEAKAQFKRLLR